MISITRYISGNSPLVAFDSKFLKTLSERGFIHQCTDFASLDKVLVTEKNAAAYLGFDATAKSLHVGSLLQIMVLRHLQSAGHKPVILIGDCRKACCEIRL